eukprot:CAMPEP_0172179102 /NCGR_PEP_ID=MMETSP1050-20130122/16419_1 /TAXON_ID=233186 /ORGANISM="Cryptomonas curvata, Strain CCAP979/52" /LENGTH=416 /DNA_ID=CAMNT_0012851923 /DNA_START=154 /DNA_END=1404 /DNA_ORIENTATION=+
MQNITGPKDCGRGSDQACISTVKIVKTGQCKCREGSIGGGFAPCLDNQKLKDLDDVKRNASLAQGQLLERAKRCTDAAAPFPCPGASDVPAENRDQCKAGLLECFGGNATLARLFFRAREAECPSEQKRCPTVEGCVAATVDCVPAASRCAADKPFRCPADAKCVAQRSACAAATDPCPGQVLCPDGVTCKADRAGCARVMSWNGPPPGQMECPQRRGFFADSADDCVNATGCPQGTKFCGGKLSGDMLPLINASTGIPIPECRPNCASARAAERTVSDFKPDTVRADGSADRALPVKRGDGGLTGAVMRLKKDGFRPLAAGSAGGVNFTVTAVPDSARDQGPFRGLLQRLWSPLITITPSVQVAPPPDFSGQDSKRKYSKHVSSLLSSGRKTEQPASESTKLERAAAAGNGSGCV